MRPENTHEHTYSYTLKSIQKISGDSRHARLEIGFQPSFLDETKCAAGAFCMNETH